jgi:phosphopantothenoylcysteine decarboxylase / phosphopantothenate---cysteine ligase
MRVLITAGPTRQPIDDVRFITNHSSGKMGVALACVFQQAGWDVTLLLGPVDSKVVESVHSDIEVKRFETVDDLQSLLTEAFPRCDVLAMAAAVGDFRPAKSAGKLSRSAGPIDLHLEPTEDISATVATTKRPDQFIISFAVESGDREMIEAKARKKLATKNGDVVLLNTPDAMGVGESEACVLSADGVVVPWAHRTKVELAQALLVPVMKHFGPAVD